MSSFYKYDLEYYKFLDFCYAQFGLQLGGLEKVNDLYREFSDEI